MNSAQVVAEMAQLNIFKDEEILKYCAERKISHRTILEWGIGAFPEDPNQLYQLYQKIHKNKDSWEFIRYLNGAFESGFLRNRLIIPIKDSYGEIIALIGRTTFTEKIIKKHDIPKYYNSQYPKTKMLFGLYEALPHIIKTDSVFVCEGNMDVITSASKNLKNVVAASSANLSYSQFMLLSRYASNIIVAFDSDEAGEDGKQRALKKYSELSKKIGCTISSIDISGGKDLDEMFNKGEIKW